MVVVCWLHGGARCFWILSEGWHSRLTFHSRLVILTKRLASTVPSQYVSYRVVDIKLTASFIFVGGYLSFDLFVVGVVGIDHCCQRIFVALIKKLLSYSRSVYVEYKVFGR